MKQKADAFVPKKWEETHVDPQTQKKQQIQWHKDYIEDLQHMKDMEKETPEGLSNGRRKWFNQEITESENKIENLKEQLDGEPQ